MFNNAVSSYDWNLFMSVDFNAHSSLLSYEQTSISYSAFPIQDEYVLLTHFPKPSELTFDILKPLGKWTWVASLFSLLFFLLAFTLYFLHHRKRTECFRHSQLEMGSLAIHILCQFQQPAPINWLAGKSAACNMLIILIGIAAIYWHTLYDVQVRSSIIGQVFDKAADSNTDLDVSAYPVYDLDGNSFDEASNVLKRMEMLYADQQQTCFKLL